MDKVKFDKDSVLLKKWFKKRKYFEVVIVGVQLMEMIAKYLLKSEEDYGHEYAERKFGSKEHTEWLKIYDACREIVNESVRPNQSPKAMVLQVFLNEHQTGNQLIKIDSPMKFITKVRGAVNFRNDLAHEFFVKSFKQKEIKSTAKDCLEIISILQTHGLYN